MTCDCMPKIARKFSTIPHYRLGSIRISRASDLHGYNSIVTGLTLWYGVILDYNAMFCNKQEADQNRGRILKHALTAWSDNSSVQDLLCTLDELGDRLLSSLSSVLRFKAEVFLTELKTWKVSLWFAPLKGVLLEIFRAGANLPGRENEVRLVSAIRQVSCFLKKLEVMRPDLEDQMRKEFIEFETLLQSVVPQRVASTEYQADVLELRTLAASHLGKFTPRPLVPGHGGGAVADPAVKCWYDKHTTALTDDRVGYLLSHADLGTQLDYLPHVREGKSSRTSRFITVPKTWKKLRGISAEPAELQFWQQGLRLRIDAMFQHDEWWRQRVNQHDQGKSRELALKGSLTGLLATVDLSAASDSVTLQLIRDIFGNTELCRWLLGTRSTHTKCGRQTIRIQKYAPMGSATCFPVECMVFVLAAEVAVRRTRKPSDRVRQVRVFGDDIILPVYAVTELFNILAHIGFTVNSEKSFWTGEFREACGVEAWRGHDIAPCRFKACPSGIDGRFTNHDEISSLVAFANELFTRELHGTREYLLTILFKKDIKLGESQCWSVQRTIFATFSGECGTLASPEPTNFNLEMRFRWSLFTRVYKRIIWQEKAIAEIIDPGMLEVYDECKLATWLVRHQPDVQDFDAMWKDGWILDTSENPYARLPIGVKMVPTEKWVLPTSRDSLDW